MIQQTSKLNEMVADGEIKSIGLRGNGASASPETAQIGRWFKLASISAVSVAN
jgi:hypothetical protein